MQRAVAGLRGQRDDPLTRNGYALMTNTAATAALGVVYWLLLVHRYPAAAVGRASAAYAAMNLLAGFTSRGFNGALTRFLPQAGQRTNGLIGRAYVASALASAVLAGGFLLTVSWWGPSYSELRTPLAGLVFAGCVIAWAIFTLQDGVLVGLRSASWVLAENSAFGLAKIILLVLLVAALPGQLGIYVSWMLPAVAAIPLVNLLIFGVLVPRHSAATGEVRPPSERQIRRFLAGDYPGTLCLFALNLVPVVVAARIGAGPTAYFYMAWVITVFVVFASINMAMSLTVEGSFAAESLSVNCRRALCKMAVLLVPSTALLIAFAPWVLRLFGAAYAAHAVPALRLLALAALLGAVTELYLGALRAQSRTSLVALVQAARGVMMLGLAVVLTGVLGTAGAALAVLASQAVIAVVAGICLWRILLGDRNAKVPVITEVSA